MQCLAFGWVDVPVRLGAWGLRVADRLILQAYVPLSLVGVYSIGQMLGATAFELVASSVNLAIMPFFYQTALETSEPSSKRIFADIAAWNAVLLGLLGLGTVLFAREIIVIFATARFLDAEPIVLLIAWASIFQALAHVPTRGVYFAKKTGWLPLVFLGPAALNIALNFAMVPRWGIMGPALAALVAYPVFLVLTLVVAQRVYSIPYDYKRIAKPLVIVLGLSLAKALVPAEPMAAAILVKALLLFTYPVALAASGFLTDHERLALHGLARRFMHLAPGKAHGGER
jgi:O-antigen/teichoic acid export membrane protein